MAVRICYLINGFNGGGAAAPVADVVGALQALGHEVSVVALMRQDGRAEPHLSQAGIRTLVLGPERLGTRSFVRLMRHLRRTRPDLLWTSLARATLLGQLAGKLLGIPVVSWQHNAWLKPVNRVLMRWMRDWSRLWVADSDAVRGFAIERIGIPPGKLIVWPLFIADPSAPMARPWRDGEPFRLGSLGRLHPNKRYDVLLQALARLPRDPAKPGPKLQVAIAGSGREHERLLEMASALALADIEFVGFVPNPSDYLAGLHGYVQPSRNEGLCLAAHEALQAGLPVVATPVGQMAHSIVDGRNGWQVPIDDADALAAAIARLIADPAAAAHMGATGRAMVLERYSRQRFEAIGAEIMRRVQAV